MFALFKMTQTINNLKDIKVNLKEMDRKMDRWEQNLILSPMTKKSPAPTPKSPSTKLIKSPKTTSSPTPNKKSPSSPTPNKKSPTKKSPTKKSPTKKSPTKKSPPKKEQKKKTGVNKIKKPRIFPMKRKKTIKTRGVYVITLAPPVTEIKKVNFTKKKLIVVVN
jgi:hypothetical protein